MGHTSKGPAGIKPCPLVPGTLTTILPNFPLVVDHLQMHQGWALSHRAQKVLFWTFCRVWPPITFLSTTSNRIFSEVMYKCRLDALWSNKKTL